MKKYFVDGLVQVAILFSLMRSDLNNLDNYFNELEEPEIHDIFMGQSSAYLQAAFHQQNRWHYSGGSVSPKSVIERDIHIRDIIRDLSRPSNHRSAFGADLDTWLVSDVTSRGLHHQLQQPSVPEQEPLQQVPAIVAPPVSAVTGGGTTTVEDVEEDDLSLSKEDVDLIEVLWEQDVDLGPECDSLDAALFPLQSTDCSHNKAQDGRSANQAGGDGDDGDDSKAGGSDVSSGTDAGCDAGNDLLLINQETGEREIPGSSPDWGDKDEPTIAQYDENSNLVPTQNQVAVDPGLSIGDPDFLHDLDDLEALEEDLRNSHLSLEEDVMYSEYSPYQPMNDFYHQPDTPASHRDSLYHSSSQPVSVSFSQYAASSHSDSGQQMNYSQTEYAGSGLANYSFPMTGNVSLTSPDHLQTWNNFSDYIINNNNNNNSSQSDNTIQLLPAGNTTLPPSYALNTTMSTATNLTSALADFDTSQLFPNITAPGGEGQNVGVVSCTGPGVNVSQHHTHQSMIDLLDSEDMELMDLHNLNFTSDASSQRGSNSSPVSVSDSAVSMGSGGSPLTISPAYNGTAGASGGQDEQHSSSAKYRYSAMKCEYDYYEPPETSHLNSGLYDGLYYSNVSNSLNRSQYDLMSTVSHNHTYMSPSQPIPQQQLRAKSQKTCLKPPKPRDVLKARLMRLPLNYEEIIDIPVEDLASVLQQHRLNDEQLQLIRDIRRRGKNKLAAQNCRKRRIQEIDDLDAEVNGYKKEKIRLMQERTRLEKELIMVRTGYERLYDDVFRSLRDDSGTAFDRNSMSLEMSTEGHFVLVPRNSSGNVDLDSSHDSYNNNSADRKQ